MLPAWATLGCVLIDWLSRWGHLGTGSGKGPPCAFKPMSWTVLSEGSGSGWSCLCRISANQHSRQWAGDVHSVWWSWREHSRFSLCVFLYPSCFLLKSLYSEILDLLSVVVSFTSPVLCICLLVFMSLYFSFCFVLFASCVTVCLFFFRPPVLAA